MHLIFPGLLRTKINDRTRLCSIMHLKFNQSSQPIKSNQKVISNQNNLNKYKDNFIHYETYTYQMVRRFAWHLVE